MMTFHMTILAGFAATLTTTAHAGDRVPLLDVLNEDDAFSTLVSAIDAADLTETLSGPGPFTIYAPTNSAFENLPEGTLQVLLLPENADELTDIILYHVDDRKLTSKDYVFGPEHYRPILAETQHCITSLDGLTIADGTGEIATVTQADIKASNGVIHMIDKVLVPGEKPRCHM